MKTLITLALCCGSVLFGICQTPLFEANAGTTRAVIVGISDYQDTRIPPLRFSHRDAEAFANWLKSPSGGSLPEENIMLLVNEQATIGNLMAALGWLIEWSKPEDRAFLFFSGHGDVETLTKYKGGYLLLYDTPASAYGAGGFSLDYLKDIISSLSEENIQTFVIADACHSGKLSGEQANGKKLTAMRLATQYANEIKILSCHPDELSLEGKQWGGGRGCFSYHLEQALYGFADQNNDQVLDVMEVERYLQDKVSTETAPQSQLPMVQGGRKTVISYVDKATLAEKERQKSQRPVQFFPAESKGLNIMGLGKISRKTEQLYELFLRAIESGDLMTPPGKSANDYYIQLMEIPDFQHWQGNISRRFAAALINEGQQISNRILNTDPQVLDSLWTDRLEFDHLPEYYRRACELLGEEHYMYRHLKAVEFYFQSKTIRKSNYPDKNDLWIYGTKKKYLGQALKNDRTNPLIYFEMGETLFEQSRILSYVPGPLNKVNVPRIFTMEMAKVYYNKAQGYAPNWVLPHYTFGQKVRFLKPAQAIKNLKKAIAVNPDFLPSYFKIAEAFDILRYMKGEPAYIDSAKVYRELAVAKFYERSGTQGSIKTSFECKEVGEYLYTIKKYSQAKEVLLEGESLSKGQNKGLYYSLGKVYTELMEFDKAVGAFEKSDLWGQKHLRKATILYHYMHEYGKGLAALKEHFKAIKGVNMFGGEEFQTYLFTGTPGSDNASVGKRGYGTVEDYFYAAELATARKKPEEATWYYEKILKHDSRNLYAWIALYRLGRKEECQEKIDFQKRLSSVNKRVFFDLARFYATTGQESMAVSSFEKAINLGWEPALLIWGPSGTLCDPMLQPIREKEAFKKLVRKHFPEHYDFATRVPGRK